MRQRTLDALASRASASVRRRPRLGRPSGSVPGQRTPLARPGRDRPVRGSSPAPLRPERSRSTRLGTSTSTPRCSSGRTFQRVGFWLIHQVSHLLRRHGERFPGGDPVHGEPPLSGADATSSAGTWPPTPRSTMTWWPASALSRRCGHP